MPDEPRSRRNRPSPGSGSRGQPARRGAGEATPHASPRRRSTTQATTGNGQGVGDDTLLAFPTEAAEAAVAEGPITTEDTAEVEMADFRPEIPRDADIPGRASRRERKSLGNFMQEWRPSTVTAGLSASPLILLTLLNAFDELGQAAYGVLIPEIRDWFGIDLTTVIVLGNVRALLLVLLSVPIGFLADRVNRVKVTAFAALVLAVSTLLVGFAPNIWWLAVFLFGAGLAKAVAPMQQTLLADYYPLKSRGSVFAFHGIGNPAALFLAPILAGTVLFTLTGFWQVPFVVFALPVFVIAFLILRLREPVRGNQERRAMGAGDTVAEESERAPGWAESFRVAWSVRTLRRLWFGIPFITGSATIIGPLFVTLLDEKFGLGPGARGVIAAIDEPAGIAGLIMGGAMVNRLLRFRPGRVMAFLGLLVASAAISFLLAALTPFLWLVVILGVVRAFAFGVVTPAIIALINLVTPPRVRGFANGVGAIWAVPGLAFGIIAGGIGDTYGVEMAMVMMSGIFLAGALIWTTAASMVEPDMRAATASAMAMHESREAKDRGKAKLLVSRDVDVSYGNVQVLFNVDFDVEEGEMIALLGTNGAGKSTLLRAISGLTAPSNGAIFYDGEDITYLPANEHVGRGIVLVNGGRGVFPTLTVAENLRLAAWLYRSDDDYVRDGTGRVLEFFPILRERYEEPAGNLSGGEQQMLTIAQAFLSRPRLLMIDELSLGLAPAIVEQLLEIVRAIHRFGTTIVLVEQSVNLALTVADRAVFMEKGEIRFTGPTAELLERNDILRSVFLKGASASAGSLGGERSPYAVAKSEKKRVDPDRPKVLVAHDIRKRFGGVSALDGIDFALEEGVILGIIGPNGAGKTTLFDVLSGFLEPDAGTVSLFGEDITFLSPDQRSRLGLQRSFQDARLFPALTVVENISVALERHIEARSAAMAALHLPNVKKSEAKIGRRVDRLIQMTNLGDYRNKFVRELSTGSRRIVDLACILAADPKVILLDEPSSGVAQRETEQLGPLLLRIRYETGCSMLLIEHDMPLITSVSDELLALDLGRPVTRGLPSEVIEHPDVVESYLGTNEDAIKRSGELA